MGIFGSKSDKKKISLLEQENKQNRKRIKQLENPHKMRWITKFIK